MNFSPSPALAKNRKDLKDPEAIPLRYSKSRKEDRQCLLVVDNNSAVAEILNEALEEWGYHVLVARNGWEGLMVAERHQVDGMLVDMHMPIMDGRTMLNELRWLGHQMPVLMISNKSDERILRQLLMEGAQGFFLKPFHLPSLKQVCRQVFIKDKVEENPASYSYSAQSK